MEAQRVADLERLAVVGAVRDRDARADGVARAQQRPEVGPIRHPQRGDDP
jgi:hypothetical protein